MLPLKDYSLSDLIKRMTRTNLHNLDLYYWILHFLSVNFLFFLQEIEGKNVLPENGDHNDSTEMGHIFSIFKEE